MELKGTKTEKNLWTAFAGESQARNKYTMHPRRAKTVMFRLQRSLKRPLPMRRSTPSCGSRRCTATPFPARPTTCWTPPRARITSGPICMPRWRRTPRKRAFLFEEVGKIEREHENRYRKLLANVEGGLVFSRDGDMVWQCSNCGHIVIGKNAPEVCPVCAHPKAYFQLKAENY